MDEALGREPGQQALHDPLLQVHLDDVFRDHTRIFENDRPNGRSSSPFPELLLAWFGWPQRVHRVGPSRVSPFLLLDGGEAVPRKTAGRPIGRFERVTKAILDEFINGQ